MREVVWVYPRFHDQATYLDASYRTYEAIRLRGWRMGLLLAAGFHPGSFAPAATGALVHLEAATAFFVLGPGRMTALWLGFAHFALLQIVLAWTVRHLSGRWSVALTAVALLLCARAPFREPGGVFDFRLDFITVCLFGAFVCVVVRSGVFAHRRWALVAGIVAAWVIAFRFLTAAYFAPVFAALVLLVGRSRRRNVLLAGGVAAALSAGILWHHRASLQAYYVQGHLHGPDRYIRAKRGGIVSAWDGLTFYPRSLVADQCGPVFFVVAAAVVLASWHPRNPADEAGKPGARRAGVTLDPARWRFAALCVVIPLLVLTADVDKSRVVGGIMVPPLVWLVLLPAIGMHARAAADAPPPALKHRLTVLAIVSLAAALGCQISRYMGSERPSRHRADVLRVTALYDRVGELALERGWSRPILATDSHADFLMASAINAMSYERRHVLLNADETLANTLSPLPEARVLEILSQADLVVLTRRRAGSERQYPFDRQMQAMHPRLLDWCEGHLRRDLCFQTDDRQIRLYVRDDPTGALAGYRPTTQQTAEAARRTR